MAASHKSHESKNALSSDDRKEIDGSKYAFPEQRKEPLNDASHVRNAIARFDQVKDVTDDEREQRLPSHQSRGQEIWRGDDRNKLEAVRRQTTYWQFIA